MNKFWIWFLGVFVFFASIFDIISTFAILNTGGSEINPLMNFVLINFGRTVFATLKMTVTIFCVLYLCLHAYKSKFTQWTLGIIALCYYSIVVYHSAILLNI